MKTPEGLANFKKSRKFLSKSFHPGAKPIKWWTNTGLTGTFGSLIEGANWYNIKYTSISAYIYQRRDSYSNTFPKSAGKHPIIKEKLM
jgi:hypothetical protein